MKDITNEVIDLLRHSEGETLEYKVVLPPSKNIAQLISAFANSKGGYIILGVTDSGEVVGLNNDYKINAILHKALDLLSGQPNVYYQYVLHNGKSLYAIKTEKSDVVIKVEGKTYKRVNSSVIEEKSIQTAPFKSGGYAKIQSINNNLETYKKNATNAKIKFVEHCQSVLKLFDDLSILLYPQDALMPTTNPEGKILLRILFSSIADNFETYLSDVLYEIYISKKETLKSESQVSIKDVLDCTDIEEFVRWYAKKKIGNLQKGSIKGFIKENKQISDLKVLDSIMLEEIEKILQIRHLYSHRNGIVDEKFLHYFNGLFVLNAEHSISISEVCDKLEFLARCIHQIDNSAVVHYGLSVVTTQ